MRSALALALMTLGFLGGCSGGSPAGSYQVPTTAQQKAKLLSEVPLQGDQKQKVLNKLGVAPTNP